MASRSPLSFRPSCCGSRWRYCGDIGAAADRPCARRCGACHRTGADLTGARQIRPLPRGPRAVVVGRRCRDRQEPSQNFGTRNQETAKAQEALVDSLKKVKGLEVRIVEAGQADGETDGTKLFGALSSALADVPVERVAGAS